MSLNCTAARDLLLDHVYGALEDADDVAVRGHLRDCDACRESLEEARRQRDVLATAARTDAPGLVFTPPRRFLRRPRRALAIAAGVLVACAGAGLLWRAHEIRSAEERYPRVAVLAPSALSPGQPAEFVIDVTTVAGDPLPASVRLDVYGPDQRQLATRTVAAGADGKARAVLDAGLGRPGEQLRVDVTASLADGIERRASTLVVRDGTRLLARVSTDKPLYRPGEPVRVRAVALERFRLTPAGDLQLVAEVLDPRGTKIATATIAASNGVSAWEWPIPDGAAGGEYRVVLTSADAAHPAFPRTERKFVVKSYRVPRIKGDLELDHDSYGPGAAGELALSIERAEGGVPAGATLESVVTVDGKEFGRSTQILAASGRAIVKFTLPKDISEGRGQVAVVVRDGGNVETLAKSLPIAIGRLDVTYFPEGGELVAGLPNRVYFEVKEPKGEAADLVADVVDGAGRKVAEAKVDDLGMGRFELTPQTGATYRLVARKPAAIALAGEFPAVVDRGVTLRSLDDVTGPRAPIRVEVAATTAGRHTISAFCRGALIAQDSVELSAGEARLVELKPTSDVGGVVRVTAFDARGVPRAERLVSLAPPHRIDLDVRPAAAKFAPGETVKVDVAARDENGRPVAAVLGVSVVDEAMLKFANDEDTASFPLHFLLGLEVEELEKADVYVKGEHAARAVDRLLGVQGWRRFAWKEPAAFLAKNAENGSRIVLANTQESPQRADNLDQATASIARARHDADRELRGIGLAGGIGVIVLAALVGIMSLRRRWVGLIATVGLCAAFVATVAVLVPTMQSARLDMTVEKEVVFAAVPRVPAPSPPAEDDAVALDELLAQVPFAGSPPEFAKELGELKPQVGGGDDGRGVFVGLLVVDQPVADLDDREKALEVGDEKDARMFRNRRMAAEGRLHVLAREYAHRKQRSPDGARHDFADVLYWNPLLVTDAQGHAHFDFDTSDSVTTFAIGVDAHDGRGALATAASNFANRIPFFLEPKLPVALSAGDVLRLPVVVANDTDAALDVGVDLALSGDLLKNQGTPALATTVAAGTRGRVLYELLAGHGRGDVALTLVGRGRGLTDRSVRTIPIVPRGYPIDIAKGGVLEKKDVIVVHLPEDFDRRTLTGSLRLYPTTLSTLEDGLESMLREPCGCFEQASSSNYPNVLVLNYIGDEGNASPEAVRRAKELLAHGYAMLTGYECKSRGYEWFGGDPGHEALSAYGLMEFVDMAKVHPVDGAMITRTRDWLLARRDGKGGFQRNQRALDSFGGAPAEITDAYCTWAITEADATADIAKELAALVERGRTSDDAYLVALAARAAANRHLPDAKALLDRLASLQKDDGHLVGKTTSITSSTGANLDVETTALAAMAFVTDPARLPNAERAIRFLTGERKKGGSFGATQATILALRALVEHARASKHTTSDHDVALTVNGNFVVKRHIAAGAPGAIAFEREILETLQPGENRIELTDTSAETLPWALALRYHADVPASDPNCAVAVTTQLAKDVVPEGETVRLDVTLANRRADGIPMTLARIGLPSGLEPREEQLKALVKSGEVDFYETRPREVTLYLRGMAPSSEKRLALDLVAAIPGTFEGPATSAYLYYTDDAKCWTAPLRVTVEVR